MPINTRPQIPEDLPIPPDVLNPVRYRFGGYTLPRDMQNDNIIIRWNIEPQFQTPVDLTYAKTDLRNP